MVAGYQDGRYLEPSEISFSSDACLDPAADAGQPPCLNPTAARERLDALVAACGVREERSPFDKQKEQLLSDLASPYALFCFVEAHPDLAAALHKHKALEGRVRGLSKDKTALLSIYCKMYPDGADQKKKCSDWTSWLEQADYENIAPNDFVAWGMEKSFIDCRDKVRDRRRVAKLSDGGLTDAVDRPVRLSLRQTSTGASVTLKGRRFDIGTAAMKRIVAAIERAALENKRSFDNDNDGSEPHA